MYGPLPLCSSILQAGTCQILSLAECGNTCQILFRKDQKDDIHSSFSCQKFLRKQIHRTEKKKTLLMPPSKSNIADTEEKITILTFFFAAGTETSMRVVHRCLSNNTYNVLYIWIYSFDFGPKRKRCSLSCNIFLL